jgi:hypothetical protein
VKNETMGNREKRGLDERGMRGEMIGWGKEGRGRVEKRNF